MLDVIELSNKISKAEKIVTEPTILLGFMLIYLKKIRFALESELMTLGRFPILVDEIAQLGLQNSRFEVVFKSYYCK